MRRATLIGMGVVTLCVFSVAIAQQRGQGRGDGQNGDCDRGGPPPGQHPVSPVIAALDTDQDGTLSAEEIAAAPTALLTLDQNSDGVLTRDELRPPRPPRGAGEKAANRGNRGQRGQNANGVSPLMQQDANGDGVVTLDEFTARASAAFDKIDTNGDGQIDADEAAAAPPPQRMGRRPGGRGLGQQPDAQTDGGE